MENETNGPKTHQIQVLVLEDCAGNSDKKVSAMNPGRITVNRGDFIEWNNHSNEEVFMFFPDKHLFVEEVNLVTIGGVEANTLRLQVSENDDIKPDDQFPYAVFARETRNFAKGSMDPVIIIRR